MAARDSNEVTIRAALAQDSHATALIHVRSRQDAYRSQAPGHILDSLSVEGREQRWRGRFADSDRGVRVWLAERGGQAMGFASTGPARDQNAATNSGEVYAISVHPKVIATGVDRLLFDHAAADLGSRVFQATTLWVLETNRRARRFSEIAEWSDDGPTRREGMQGVELREVRYHPTLARPARAGDRGATPPPTQGRRPG